MIPKKPKRIAGLMSGTSADGVDVAVVDVARGRVDVVAFGTTPYRPSLRRQVKALFDPATGSVEAICHMNFVLGEVFAAALLKTCRAADIPLDSIDAVGSHGQTIHHLPRPRRVGGRSIRSTLQIGEPAVIAERTGLCVVADFRPRDIAAGGSGAPLVPMADFELLSHPTRSRAVQNIGGIANVTYLPAGGKADDVLAFDTGPGNVILDTLVQGITGGRRTFDRDGRMSRRGRVCQPLLAAWLRHPYFAQRPPKSTGPEAFGRAYCDGLLRQAAREGLSHEDTIATATALTAESIARAYRRYLPGGVDEAILCGGGASNPALVDELTRRLPAARVVDMRHVGIDPDAKEAVSFALLARRTLLGLPGSLPSATGADHAAVLGTIIPGSGRPWPSIDRS